MNRVVQGLRDGVDEALVGVGREVDGDRRARRGRSSVSALVSLPGALAQPSTATALTDGGLLIPSPLKYVVRSDC